MTAGQPTAKVTIAELQATVAWLQSCIRTDQSLFQRRADGQQLGGGSRRIETTDGTVEQRMGRILHYALPKTLRYDSGKNIGVEPRMGCHGQDFAAAWIHGDNSATAILSKRRHTFTLKIVVDR